MRRFTSPVVAVDTVFAFSCFSFTCRLPAVGRGAAVRCATTAEESEAHELVSAVVQEVKHRCVVRTEIFMFRTECERCIAGLKAYIKRHHRLNDIASACCV